jgi:hypothetical protein
MKCCKGFPSSGLMALIVLHGRVCIIVRMQPEWNENCRNETDLRDSGGENGCMDNI